MKVFTQASANYHLKVSLDDGDVDGKKLMVFVGREVRHREGGDSKIAKHVLP